MRLLVDQMSIPKGDHLWLGDTHEDDYEGKHVCHGCGCDMIEYARVENAERQAGLITGLCPNCGHTMRLNNLSAKSFSYHFSKRWLTGRDEDLVETPYVYETTKAFIPSGGKVLDVGCGLGGNLLAFHNRGYEVYGVEPSEHRGAAGAAFMENICIGTGEDYLENTDVRFDLIYFFDVLQFMENPYRALELASKRLTDSGVIWFKLGVYHRRSNLAQFGHFGMLRNYINLYSLLGPMKKWGLHPISYRPEPIELAMSSSEHANSKEIKSTATKLELSDIRVFAEKSLKIHQLKIFGRSRISYRRRNIRLKLARPAGDVLPIVFEHPNLSLPILLK
ncbi:class I SAM-dependent methyltransferase [Litorivicinus sp.]|nr:class I SAM-dependent methyltransferase [Litorivicinus sp.]